MPPFIRIALLCAACALPSLADAQRRPVPKLTPKIGSIGGFTSAAQLAAAIAGPGVTISNATFRGDNFAAGTFAGALSDLGIDNGVVLSTGRAEDVTGPNQSEATSTDFELPGDADLDVIVAPERTFDAAVLEFDVVPVGNTIGVRFVFASEEYNEFVGSEFNDVLAIYVNGANCANVGGRPVSVNTVNAGLNPGLFVDNHEAKRDTELDGFTVPLECVASVTPNAPNHVKIAIADTADGIYDAAVFIAAAGLRSPGNGAPTNSTITKVIEYHHAAFDHYFMTAIPGEISKLDDGTFVGWTRTGKAFSVFLAGTPDTSEVCRFFSTSFSPKSSHFYTPFAPECASVKQNPNWQFEGVVFATALPDAAGNCPAGTTQLYRVYNDGMGNAPNHRYTTDVDVFNDMIFQGWKPEGFGVGVIACVPI